MRKTEVKNLKGGEILAKDIFTSSYRVIMTKGTVLKREYIERFPLLGIEYVFIEEEQKRNEFIQHQIVEECSEKVKQVLERHIYKHNDKLADLCILAERMIQEILKEEQLKEKVIEIKEEGGDMYLHSVNVCALSTILALKMEMDQNTVSDIVRGSILHDIGLRYIMVPYENIDIYTLSLQEQNEYRKHVMYGYNGLQNESWLSQNAKDIVLFHHEYETGEGYPLRLSGEKISDAVKVVTICNAFDQMISGIGYKRTKLQEAIEFLRTSKGILFNRSITEKFLNMIVKYRTGCMVELSTGEMGKVIRQNNEMPERPVLLILYDSLGNEISSPKELDLLEKLNIFITRIID